MKLRRTLLALGTLALIAVVAAVVAWPGTGPATATGGGNSITSPDTIGDVGNHSAIVIDSSGNPVVSYADDTNGDLKLLYCGDPTCTTGNVITSPDTSGNFNGQSTSIVLDSVGNPVVSYLHNTALELRVLHCGDPTCSSGNTVATPDPGTSGGFTSLQLDASGYPVISHWGGSTGGLKVLHCGNPTCTAGNSLATPDTSPDVGLYTSLELDSSGNPVVSYYDQTNSDLKVLHCGNPNCTAGNIIATPDTADAGAFTSLELDSSGDPVVSYYRWSGGDLNLLHCGNPNCTAGNSINSVDTGGWYSSLALDSSGFPVVSHWRIVEEDLRVTHCNDVNCAGGNESHATPDSLGNVGVTSALVLDAGGHPVVSYLDVTNFDLKVLHCGNANCGAVKPTPTDTPTPTPCPPEGCPEMSLSIAGPDATCDDPDNPTTCSLLHGSAFTLAVSVNRAPSQGYVLMQTFIDYGSDLIYKKAAAWQHR